METIQRMCLQVFLAGTLLFLPLHDAQAAGTTSKALPQTGIQAVTPSSQSAQPEEGPVPLQEEMQFLTASQLAEEENLLAILWVQRSAEFRGLSYQAYNLATMEVDKALARRREKEKALAKAEKSRNTEKQKAPLLPLAVVLDIDDTLVCHAPLEVYYMEHPEAKTDYNAWEQWIAQHAMLLPGAKDFLEYADRHGVQVFYVTGRGPQDRSVTSRFLQKAGLPYTDETHLLMNDRSGSKTRHFAKLARHYDIICYIGDNADDFPIGARRNENITLYKNKTADNATAKSKMPLDITAMLKHDKNPARNRIVDTHKKSFGTKFILLPNPMYGDWEYNLAQNYRRLPAEQRIALRKAALKCFTHSPHTKS